MAGMKLLDLAAVFNASRPVLRHHVALRRRQLDVYVRTSSLTKAVRSQIDPYIQTAQAAAYFSRRMRDASMQGSRRYLHAQSGPARRSLMGKAESGANVDRAQSHLSPEESRRLQRQSESQIPSQAADPPSNQASDRDSTSLTGSHDKDVFYSRPQEAGPVLSELPRAKIPKHTEATQGSDEHVKDGQINSDVFYSSNGRQDAPSIPELEAVPEQEQTPEDVNTDVFHSPRIAKLLGKEGHGAVGKDALRPKAASSTPIERTGMARGKDQDTFNVRSSEQQETTRPDIELGVTPTTPTGSGQRHSEEAEREEMRRLAADVADDVNQASPTSDVSLRVPYDRCSSQLMC